MVTQNNPKIDRSICPVCMWVKDNYTKPKCPDCGNLIQGERRVESLYNFYKRLYETFQNNED
jgi:predicted RNA-binding Zn-ribbon protein involved in translation (DUF1610 family)